MDTMLRVVLLIIWIVSAVTASAAGLEYYLASSSVAGHGYGIFGTGFMVFGVLLYSIRKRAKALSMVQGENIFDGSVLAELTQQIRPGEPRSLPHALFLGLQWDFTRRRREKKIRSLLEAVGGHSPLRRELERLAINEGCHVVEQPVGPTASIRYVPISVTDCKSCHGGGG